ncbi:biotin--[acetyl-CoA-carboxylase] ligase [Nigerium massiliense]|uniref:biotin--[acetyl-CoA-carboxylase] ligase n=1 Tax=Nigerium massiliense TaxID=1522317 RepID=UPI0005915AEB|nr:biotin--[acetyl-CoA-carboxylase] ligase [Nigerium massiliense]
MSDFLDGASLAARLEGGLWRHIELAEVVPSTNAEVAARAKAGVPGGLVLITGYQNAGRGRFDRVWEAPPDRSIAMSALLYPRRGMRAWGWLSLLAGVAVCEGLQAATGLPATLKWPNDVLVRGRKICGILCEAVPASRGAAAVLGMGINVALRAEELPVPTATSVRLEGSDASGTDVAVAVLTSLEDLFTRWDAGQSLRPRYREHCSTLGAQVAVHIHDDRIVHGVAVDVAENGSLVVDTPEGRREFSSGDVVHLRRPGR